jgi:four helix bundle protein
VFARGSLVELETQVLIAARLRYLEAGDVEVVLKRADELGRMLTSPGKQLRERASEKRSKPGVDSVIEV